MVLRLLACLLLLGCMVDEVASRSAPIVDGVRETGEEAVVLVKVAGGVGTCSGTFISDTVVLTAKHCVQSSGLDEPYPLSLLTIGVGHQLFDTTDYRARRVDTTPGRWESNGNLGLLMGRDVATITIRPDRDGNLPAVEPLSVYRDDPRELVGEEVTFIGFGRIPEGTSGAKYKTSKPISRVTDEIIYSSRSICSGDSGGPMIVEGDPRSIVGVASFGLSSDGNQCPSLEDGHNRVDIFLGMIDAALLEAGDCPGETEEACDSLDNDCDGTIDETCKPLGESCEADDECAFAQLPEATTVGLIEPLEQPVVCGDTPEGRVCTHACNPLDPVASCAEVVDGLRPLERIATPGAVCVPVDGGCEGVCVAGERGERTVGQECERNADCASLRCLDPGDGMQRCLTPCEGDAAVCPLLEVCAAPAGACGGCVSPELVASERGIGEPCTDDSECRSETCGSEGYCTTSCERSTECLASFHCRNGMCARGAPGAPGDLCRDDGDCEVGRTCVGAPVTTCTERCTAVGCEDGFRCEEERCVLDLLALGQACGANDECYSNRCESIDGDDVCTQTCEGTGSCPPPLYCRRIEGTEPICAANPPPEEQEESDGGGCSAAGGRGLPWLTSFFFVWARRRRYTHAE